MTAGRYWFRPPNTPHYPFLHLLGSRDWRTQETGPPPQPGEWEGARTRDFGQPPTRMPLAQLVGTPECIADGESGAPLALAFGKLSSCPDFPPGCFSEVPVQTARFDIFCCHVQASFAEIILTLYQDDVRAKAQLQELIGDEFTIVSFPSTHPVRPGALVATGPVTMLLMTGTVNFQQAALQALYGTTPLSAGPGYQSTALYIEQAAVAMARITDELTGPLGELYLVGHSYGGAVATTAAGSILFGGATDRINLLTFGAPYAGDSGLRDLLAPIAQCHIASFDDPICGLPPRPLSIPALATVLGAGRVLRWDQLQPPRGRRILDTVGKTIPGDFVDLDWTVIQTAAELIATLQPVQVFRSHWTQTYIARIRFGCPEPLEQPPLPPDAILVKIINFTYTIGSVAISIPLLNATLPLVGDQWIIDDTGPGVGYASLRIHAFAIGDDGDFSITLPFRGVSLFLDFRMPFTLDLLSMTFQQIDYVFWSPEGDNLTTLPIVNNQPAGADPDDQFSWSLAARWNELSLSV